MDWIDRNKMVKMEMDNGKSKKKKNGSKYQLPNCHYHMEEKKRDIFGCISICGA